jgi:hypothetical protein
MEAIIQCASIPRSSYLHDYQSAAEGAGTPDEELRSCLRNSYEIPFGA